MRTTKLFSHFMALALIFSLLVGCGPAAAQPTATQAAPAIPVDFDGHWEALSMPFMLDLVQTGAQLQGGHSAIGQNGGKIDFLEASITGSIAGNKAAVQFQSSFAPKAGTAEITFIDAQTIFWKITAAPEGEYYLPAEATLVKKTAAAPAAPAQPGTITGRVHLQGPPTPPMVVYAVDAATGKWANVETTATDGEAPFSLSVEPGSYQVFAAVASGTSTNVGYSTDGLTLATVTVAAGQTVAEIMVRPPSQSECGAVMGYPASPDGRFAAMPGPAPDCIAALQTQIAQPQTQSQPQVQVQAPVSGNPVRIQFNPGAVIWQTQGDLPPTETRRFVLSASKGQILTVELTTDPNPGTPMAEIIIRGADGQLLTPNLTAKWKSVLLTSQDYYIEINPLSTQTIYYSLLVAIPALGSTPYVPVDLSVCQMLQEMAGQAVSASFTLQNNQPFTDYVTSETGQSCNLVAQGDGNKFSNPSQVMNALMGGLQGFSELNGYQADGPTGTSRAVGRDMAVILLNVGWRPAPGVECPKDQPISACNLSPEQKLYTIQLQAAMK